MPGAGAPPLAKVMRKEARHTQRRDRASVVPLEILEHLPPKPESAYFLLCALTHTSDFMGGCPPLPLSEKRVNLQLQLIKFLGVIVFQPTNSISLTCCVPGSVLINMIGVSSSFNVCNLGPLS